MLTEPHYRPNQEMAHRVRVRRATDSTRHGVRNPLGPSILPDLARHINNLSGQRLSVLHYSTGEKDFEMFKLSFASDQLQPLSPVTYYLALSNTCLLLKLLGCYLVYLNRSFSQIQLHLQFSCVYYVFTPCFKSLPT